MLNQLKTAYIGVIAEYQQKNPVYFSARVDEMKSPEQIAGRMLNAVKNCISNHACSKPNAKRGCDWLKHNEAMRVACKKVGIKTSKELRQLVKESEQKGRED